MIDGLETYANDLATVFPLRVWLPVKDLCSCLQRPDQYRDPAEFVVGHLFQRRLHLPVVTLRLAFHDSDDKALI